MDEMASTESKIDVDAPEAEVAVPAPVRDKIFHFQPRAETAQADQGGAALPAERRDWGAAIDLVKEASEAIRFAEERAQAADDYAKELTVYHKEQLKAAEARVAAAERRAELAQQRAAEAEGWLSRFHDAINEGFGRFTKG